MAVHESREHFEERCRAVLESAGATPEHLSRWVTRYPLATRGAETELRARGLNPTAWRLEQAAAEIGVRVVGGARVWTDDDVDRAAQILERENAFTVEGSLAKLLGVNVVTLRAEPERLQAFSREALGAVVGAFEMEEQQIVARMRAEGAPVELMGPPCRS